TKEAKGTPWNINPLQRRRREPTSSTRRRNIKTRPQNATGWPRWPSPNSKRNHGSNWAMTGRSWRKRELNWLRTRRTVERHNRRNRRTVDGWQFISQAQAKRLRVASLFKFHLAR